MAEIFNLRQARKRLDREAARKTAAQNRARFGRTRMAKAQEKAERDRLDRTVDGAVLPDDETPRRD